MQENKKLSYSFTDTHIADKWLKPQIPFLRKGESLYLVTLFKDVPFSKIFKWRYSINSNIQYLTQVNHFEFLEKYIFLPAGSLHLL